MPSPIQTAWVAPPKAGGQDHLALRAISEAIYGELVPCITNVTERIRSYAFYTWFTWRFGLCEKDTSYSEYRRLFRRAECLYTLVGAQHGIDESGSHAAANHGAALPGRDTLIGPLLTEDTIHLSVFADPEVAGKNRYFKAELGGLDQYYLGTLQQLDLMGRGEKDSIAVTPKRGVHLASVFDEVVPGDLFWKTVHEDALSVPRLRELHAFCPCFGCNQRERDTLLDILIGRDQHENVPAMRDGLRLMLDFLSADGERTLEADGEDGEASGWNIAQRFRQAAYGGVLPDGSDWSDEALTSWAGYQRHELFSIAVQSLFWAVLADLDGQSIRVPLQSSADVATWFTSRHTSALGPMASRSFESFITQVRGTIPLLASIDTNEHEIMLAPEMDSRKIVQNVLRLLAALVVRLPAKGIYGNFQRDPSYFAAYDLNLYALQKHASSTWLPLTVEQWLEWLVRHWCVGHHLRVALRKLRTEGLDTFRLKPTDSGLAYVDNIRVVWTSPRLVQLLRVLRDLGVVSGTYALTELGSQLREELHG